MEKLYTAVATATGGRDGHVKSSDGIIDLDLHTPKEMGGPGGRYSNPEQLFAAGYAACFNGALNLVARLKKHPVKNTSITMEVSFWKGDEGFNLSAVIKAVVPGVPYDIAKELVEEAHKVCPYSKATRGNIDVKLEVVNS